MRLLGVELARFRSRRAIVLLALAGALVAAVLATVVAIDTRPLSDSDRADAVAQADLESGRAELRAEVADCRQDPQAYLGPDSSAGDCADALVPPVESYYPRQPLSLRSVLDQNGINLAVAAGRAGRGGRLHLRGSRLVLGVDRQPARSSSPAGCASGRRRPLRSRSPAACWCWSSSAPSGSSSACSRAVAASPSRPRTSLSWPGTSPRAAALAMVAALGAFALTMVFRHTVATLALLFVYSVGGEILINLLPWEGSGRFAVGNNVYGWLASHHALLRPLPRVQPR